MDLPPYNSRNSRPITYLEKNTVIAFLPFHIFEPARMEIHSSCQLLDSLVDLTIITVFLHTSPNPDRPITPDKTDHHIAGYDLVPDTADVPRLFIDVWGDPTVDHSW